MSAKVRLHSVASSKRKRPAWRYQRAKLVQLPDDLLGDTVASLLDLASHVALACCCWNLNAILSLCLKAPGVCLTTPTCGLRARKYVSKMPKWALGWPAAEKFKWFNSLQTLVITDDSHIDRIIATLVGSFLHRTLPTMPQNLRELHVNFAGYVEFGEFFESLKGCRRNLLSLHLAVDIASSTACDSVTFGLLQRGSFFKNLTSFRFNVRQQLHRDFSLDRARTRLLFLSMPNLTHLECEGRFDDLVPECFPALKHLHLSERDPVSEPVTDHDPKVLDLRACTALDTVIFTEREFEVGIYILPVSVRRVHIYDAVTQFVNPSILPNLENFEVPTNTCFGVLHTRHETACRYHIPYTVYSSRACVLPDSFSLPIRRGDWFLVGISCSVFQVAIHRFAPSHYLGAYNQ